MATFFYLGNSILKQCYFLVNTISSTMLMFSKHLTPFKNTSWANPASQLPFTNCNQVHFVYIDPHKSFMSSLHTWFLSSANYFRIILYHVTYPITLLVTSLAGCLPVLCTFCNLQAFSVIASALQGTALSQYSTTLSLELSQLWKSEAAQTPGVQWCSACIHSSLILPYPFNHL